MAKLTLQHSEALTREALRLLLQAPLEPELEIAGQTVTIASDSAVEDTRTVGLSWSGGGLDLLIQIRRNQSLRRSNPEEPAQCLAFCIYPATSHQKLVWCNFEWRVRDALRDGKTAVQLIAKNTFSRRTDGDEQRNQVDSEHARRLAAESGLGDSAELVCGTYDLRTRTWSPDAGAALRIFMVVAVIKAHFFREGLENLRGQRLFDVDPQDHAERPASPTDLPPETEDLLLSLDADLPLGRLLLKSMAEGAARAAAINPLSWSVTLSPPKFGLNVGSCLLLQVTPRILWGTADLRSLSALSEGTAVEPFRSVPGLHLVRYTGPPAALMAAWPTLEKGVLEAAGLAARRASPYHHSHSEEAARLLEQVHGARIPWRNTPEPEARVEESDLEEEPVHDDAANQGDGETPALASITYEKLRLDPAAVATRLADFIAPPGVLERCCAALNAGKHLLLLGPPGTGKSTLAQALAEQAHEDHSCGGEPLLATASADWSTYDTIGGWTQRSDKRLVFREGVVTRALGEHRWIVLDEVNRADIDKCFGELFTVLSGGKVTTAYTRIDGDREVPVEIGADTEPYRFGDHIRLIATMNVRDKASLFRLSYAFMRRFAAIHVPALDDEALHRLAKAQGESKGLAEDVWKLAARALTRGDGFGSVVDLGPALLRDVLAYAAARLGSVAALPPASATVTHEHALAEAIELLVLPQLEGAEDTHAVEAEARIDTLFTDPAARRGLHESLRRYFPTLQRGS